jgi:hypothetical protein
MKKFNYTQWLLLSTPTIVTFIWIFYDGNSIWESIFQFCWLTSGLLAASYWGQMAQFKVRRRINLQEYIQLGLRKKIIVLVQALVVMLAFVSCFFSQQGFGYIILAFISEHLFLNIIFVLAFILLIQRAIC